MPTTGVHNHLTKAIQKSSELKTIIKMTKLKTIIKMAKLGYKLCYNYPLSKRKKKKKKLGYN